MLMKYLPVAQFGSALASGARGPEFKSRRADHKKKPFPSGKGFFIAGNYSNFKNNYNLKAK